MSVSKEKSFFDLHINGLGYLSRIREVKPRKGDTFLACDIAALNGPSDDVSYVRFDTRVSGSEAQHLVRRCMAAVEAEKKVMIGFRLGDLWADIFTYSKGKRAGEQGVSLKARLLFITWIKVDGQHVYKAEPRSVDQAASDTTATDQAPQESALEQNPSEAQETEAPETEAPETETSTRIEPASDDFDSDAETHATSTTPPVADSF